MSPKSSVSFKKLRQLATAAVRLPLPDGGSPVSEPLEVIRRFVKAWNRHDADGVAELFTDDVDFVNVVGLWWTSPRSIRRAHKRGFARMFGDSELVVEKLKLRWLGADAALVHARWRLTGQVDPAGQPAQPRRGIASVVVQRLADDSWIAVSWQNTDIAPNADTNVNVAGSLAPCSYLERPPADCAPVADDPSA